MLKPSTLTRAPATGVPEESDTTPLIVPVVACPKARDGATRNEMAHTARSNRVERLIRDIQTSRVVRGKGNNDETQPSRSLGAERVPGVDAGPTTTVWGSLHTVAKGPHERVDHRGWCLTEGTFAPMWRSPIH
jgi:hypothetical protein